MDAKTKLVNEMSRQLCSALTEEQLATLERALHSELDNYDVSERCTAITIPSNPSLDALKQFAVAKHLQGLSARSIKRYYYICYPLLSALGKPLCEISTFDVRGYLLRYKACHDVSNRTLDGMRLCLSAFFSWSLDEGLISKNPCEAVPQIKYDKVIKFPFSTVGMEKIKMACGTKRDRALVEVLYSTGCRVTELSQLDRTDIDFQSRTARIMGKGGKERIVCLTDIALFYLAEYLGDRDDSLAALFIGKGSSRLSKNGIEAILRRLGKVAGVEDVHPHRYRRTLATDMLNRGASIQDVAAILGHDDINTTRIYCYTSQENVVAVYRHCIS